MSARADGVHRALGEALRHGAGEHRPRLRDRIDLALVVLRRSERRAVVVVAAAIPLAVPRQLELRREAACLGRDSASARAPSSRASHSAAKSVSTPCRKKPSHVLSPRPAWPTRFMPSFQSPAPKSGRPCAPAVVPRSIARTQCSNSVPSSADTRGGPYDFVFVGREQRRRQERHALVEDAGVAGRAHVLGDDVRQPEQIVGTAACAGRGRSARATSAARRLRRTAGPRRAAGARAPGPAARTTAPSRPAADRGSRTRRRAGSSRRASRAGSSSS